MWKMLIAVPVAPRSILKNLKRIADDVISCMHQRILWPPELFIKTYAQIGDDEVKRIMKRHGYDV